MTPSLHSLPACLTLPFLDRRRLIAYNDICNNLRNSKERISVLFNSYIFVLVFFPLCMVGYFGLNHFKKYTLAQVFLLGMSLWFYGYFNPWYLSIIMVSVIGNYFITGLMAKAQSRNLQKWILIFALLANFGSLFYFKYYDFFLLNVNRIFGTDLILQNVLLPLGISFFTFQQMSYVIDAYKGQVQQYNFLQYASFVTYFPQLIAGPIVTHDELIPQFMDLSKKAFNWDNFAKGLYIFALGLTKKVLIADTFGGAVNWAFSDVAALDTTNAFFASLAYTIQIYFDFSGYCDMAIGIGQMMNLELPINFDSPYKALTITEFWGRWHKTLTRFFTRYIYIPLGGSRKGALRTYVNVMIVYLVSGIWHGANYTFILWGILHGVFSVFCRWKREWFEKMHPALSWLITFAFINLSMALFRANSIADFLTLVKRLLAMDFGPIRQEMVSAFQLPELMLLIRSIPQLEFLLYQPSRLLLPFFGGAMFLILGARNAHERMLAYKPSLLNLLATSILLFWCIMSFSGVSTFLYFNF